MKPAVEYYQSDIASVAPGAIFLVSIGQAPTFCMAIEPLENESIPGLLALSPGHPMLKNKVGVLSGSVIAGQSIVVYPDAVLLPSPKPEHIRFHSWQGIPIGCLILIEREFFVVAAFNRMQKAAYSCQNGSFRQGAFSSDRSIIVTSWEVMIEGPGGEPHQIFSVDANASAVGESEFY